MVSFGNGGTTSSLATSIPIPKERIIIEPEEEEEPEVLEGPELFVPSKIFTGNETTHIIDSNGSVWGTGLNTTGQLSVGDIENKTELTPVEGTNLNIFSVSKNANATLHTGFIDETGFIFSSGSNINGQLRRWYNR